MAVPAEVKNFIQAPTFTESQSLALRNVLEAYTYLIEELQEKVAELEDQLEVH